MDVLADFRGHAQRLQIQRGRELDAFINRIRQHQFFSRFDLKSPVWRR